MGFGGDCGTRVINILHQAIKDKDIVIVIGVMPFNYEGTARKKKALDTVIKTKSLYKELKLFGRKPIFI